MNINWLDNRRTRRANVDVDIRIVGRKDKHLSINFSNGIIATRFKNSDRIMVGFDEDNKYLCFAPGGTEGYKIVRQNGIGGKIQIHNRLFEGHREMHELCGAYALNYDPESKVSFIEIKAFK